MDSSSVVYDWPASRVDANAQPMAASERSHRTPPCSVPIGFVCRSSACMRKTARSRSISTGIFGYPVAEAAAVALGAVRDALHDGTYAGVVRFVLFSEADLEAYTRALDALPTEPT